MRMSTTRIRAIFRKELREYRRNRQIVVTMAIFPLFFSVYPIVEIFGLPASSAGAVAQKQPLVYMLGIPALVPAALAAYSVAGERQQGTLEPVLTTPIRAKEFLLGKALAVLVPALAVSYIVFGVFVAAIELLAQPAVTSAVLHGPELLALLLFTPLVAALSIWTGIAISARSNDTRVAQQLSILAGIPAIIVTTTIAVGGIHATLHLALALGVVLLILDLVGWRIVPPLLGRERLITGTKA
jgi:ABC-type transport system involved in multi-copper enzyme maturation permease subunit